MQLHKFKVQYLQSLQKKMYYFLINSIEVKKGISPQDIERVLDNIIDSLERNCDDIVNKDDCEFEISYNNRLEVTEVPINFDFIRESIENNLCEFEGGEEEEEVDADEKELEEIKRIEEDNN